MKAENNMNQIDWREFASSNELAKTLARDVADRLRKGLRDRGGAVLAVSGGSTPGAFFEALSSQQLDWVNVVVTLVDERFVPPSSSRSNERLVRERLLVNEARLARFVPLYSKAESADEAARLAESGLAVLSRRFDVIVLGMGSDGHTASLFPDAGNLDELLDQKRRELVMPVHAESAGEARLTLPLARIVEAGFLALHIEGKTKKNVLEAAMSPGAQLPITAVLNAAPSRIAIYWAG